MPENDSLRCAKHQALLIISVKLMFLLKCRVCAGVLPDSTVFPRVSKVYRHAHRHGQLINELSARHGLGSFTTRTLCVQKWP